MLASPPGCTYRAERPERLDLNSSTGPVEGLSACRLPLIALSSLYFLSPLDMGSQVIIY
jgi:hypothetical protein